MARTPALASALWLVLGACGGDDGANHLPDGHIESDAQPLAVVPATLALSSPCGVAMPDTVDLPIMNGGPFDLVVSAAAPSTGFTVTTALPITIAPGATMSIAIRPPAAVIGTDLGGDTKSGTVTITTNDSLGSHDIALVSTVAGANVAFSDANGPISTFHLDGANDTCPDPLPLTIRNSGTIPVTIDQGTLTGFSGFGFSGFSGATIDAGGTATVMVGMQNSMTQCSGTATLAFAATADALCTPGPAVSLEYSISGSTGTCFCS